MSQVGCTEECVVGAGGRARWALPEPEGAAALALRAPGGPRLTLPLHALHDTHTLLYQNFIYVAFLATASNSSIRYLYIFESFLLSASLVFGKLSSLWHVGGCIH